MAARLERELGVEVDKVHGRFGEYKVLVDGETVVDAGAKAALGILPNSRKVVEQVRARL